MDVKTSLLQKQVLFRGQKLCLMTSHFESCKANAGERMRQLGLVMKMMAAAPDDVTVLFGGDTNLRDAEVCLLHSDVFLWPLRGVSGGVSPHRCRGILPHVLKVVNVLK